MQHVTKFENYDYDIWCDIGPQFPLNTPLTRSLTLHIQPPIKLDVHTNRFEWTDYPKQCLGVCVAWTLDKTNPEYVYMKNPQLYLIVIFLRNLQGVKIATIEFPHLYVLFHLNDEFYDREASFKIGDEQCLRTQNIPPEMNELCLQVSHHTFTMVINGHNMGGTHNIDRYQSYLN